MRYSLPSRETVQLIRESFPVGCKVELVRMEDIQAPPVGTKGEVLCVDSIGTIHVRWENGSSLGVCYGEDYCRRVT